MAIEAHYLDEETATRYDLAPGWWAFDEAGPILGPYQTRADLLLRAEVAPLTVIEHSEDRCPST